MAYIPEPVTFEVADATDYFLTITIGGGVVGGTTSMGDFAGKLHSPQVINVPIGLGRDIRGKSLDALIIFEANGPGNFAGVDYTLNGVTETLSRPLYGDLSWVFSTKIKFK